MSDSPRLAAALARALEDERRGPQDAPRDGAPRTRRVAMGDPQAPLARVLAVLDAHGLLGDDGRLRPEVHLVSVGDHFDWGGPLERAQATTDATRLLAWLAAHPADQVTLLAGNHDLARVGELARFDDATFARAQAEADAAYWHHAPRRPEADFCAEYDLPSWEVVARDLGAFRTEQRAWVAALLRRGRLCAAFAAAPDLLVCHAGVTRDELAALGLPDGAAAPPDARELARALNAALAAAAARWPTEVVAIPRLHRPGDATGEGTGMFFHRPSVQGGDGPLPRRRFDPRRLPTGLVQAVGHVRDAKCRELLGAPVDPARSGPLRHLRVGPLGLVYDRGVPDDHPPDVATVLFLDGAMRETAPASYELLDLDSRRPLEPPAP